MLFQTGSGAVRPRQTKRHILYQGCECIVHAIFTICVLFLVCYSILNASCEKSFAQLHYDLIDHLAISLALELAHNSLHDGAFVLAGDDVSEFLLDDFLHFLRRKLLRSVLADHIVAELVLCL